MVVTPYDSDKEDASRRLDETKNNTVPHNLSARHLRENKSIPQRSLKSRVVTLHASKKEDTSATYLRENKSIPRDIFRVKGCNSI